MSVFVSYSSLDEVAAKEVIGDLEAARYDIWYDRELTGGESWWQEILAQIRSATVFVLVLSPNSLRSRPCQAELHYAQQLRLPVLPVLVGDVADLRTTPVAAHQVVDYRPSTRATGIALVSAASYLGTRREPLPSPLPAPPPIPYEYLMRLGRSVDAPSIAPHDQMAIVAQLRQGLRDEDDPSVQRDLVALLLRLRGRSDVVTWAAVREIDAALADAPQPSQTSRKPRKPADRGRSPSPSTDAGRRRLKLVAPLLLAVAGVLWAVVFEAQTGEVRGLMNIGSVAVVVAVVWALVRLVRWGRASGPAGGDGR